MPALLLSALACLRERAPIDEARLRWLVILHLTFIASGVLFAVMDWIAALTDAGKEKEKRASETARSGGR
ncbi:MAG: hypothetical protein AB7I68_05100 [Porticoccaceae bacterium]